MERNQGKIEDYKKLCFRRQFIMTRVRINGLADWQYLEIGPYFLYAHPDIEVNQIHNSIKNMVVIGSLFDPFVPEKGNIDVIKDINDCVNNISDLFSCIKRYAGRFVLIYVDDKHSLIMNDALGLREVYYCTADNHVVCGSQPNLIIKFASPEIGITEDTDLLDFYNKNSKNGKWNPSCKWIGDITYYQNVRHLLPNHYLHVKNHKAVRYWPKEPIKSLDLDEVVSRSCSFLQGALKAIAYRHPIMMAVTAGTDSRTLLAASKALKDKVYYFINDHGLGHDHPDIAVPNIMCRKVGIKLHIHDVPKNVDQEFRRIFLDNAFFASDRILSSIYNVYFKKFSDKVNVLGIGEIGRSRFGKEPKNLQGYRLGYLLGHKKGKYILQEGQKILAELFPVGSEYGLNILTLLYWEQYLGNWGATGNSESDIAIEEINPFDSHFLYEILLGVDDRYSDYNNPIVFKAMIHNMWPELLDYPINPPHTLKGKLTKTLKEIGIYPLFKEIKYQVNYLRYNNKRCM